MNILYICQTDPASVETGSAQRTHFLYKALCRLGDVHVLCQDGALTVTPERKMLRRRPPSGLFKKLADRLCWSFYCRIYPICPHLLPFPRDLNVEESFPGVTFDLVVARYLYEPAVSRPWRHGPLWIDIDDHPLQVFETSRTATRIFFMRWFGKKLIRFATDYLVRHAEGCWVANPGQIGCFAQPGKIQPLENVVLFPPREYNPASQRGRYLLMVGHMAYEPNYAGADRFLEETWPRAKALHPDIEFWIAGKDLPARYQEKWAGIDGVKYLGFVEDLATLYERCLATIVPVDGGGGTCIKTKESLAYSRLCLSTPFGARGIPEADIVRGANGLVVFDSAAGFLDALALVLDDSRRMALEKSALSYARRNFSEEMFYNQVEASIGKTPIHKK